MEKKRSCFGAGLVALDVILNGNPSTLPKLSAGGSCGNVLSILSYLGWSSYPIARLANDQAAAELIQDLNRWHVHTNHITINDDGSTPIIIHRILKDKIGKPIHRFEFRDPETKTWLPQFKAITKSIAANIIGENIKPNIFYLDRMNPGTFELAKYLKSKGTIIFFEPSSNRDESQFEKFLSIADIVKFSHERVAGFSEKYSSITCYLEIETLGKDGLVYRTKKSSKPNQWKRIKGFSLSSIQDTAGAGDWCTAGIIQSLFASEQVVLSDIGILCLEEAMRFGQALGALNCIYDGARGLMYYYYPEKLISVAQKFIAEKTINPKSLPSAPKIDISTQKRFSELLMDIA